MLFNVVGGTDGAVKVEINGKTVEVETNNLNRQEIYHLVNVRYLTELAEILDIVLIKQLEAEGVL